MEGYPHCSAHEEGLLLCDWVVEVAGGAEIVWGETVLREDRQVVGLKCQEELSLREVAIDRLGLGFPQGGWGGGSGRTCLC